MKNEEKKRLLEYAKKRRAPHEDEMREVYNLVKPSREFLRSFDETTDRTQIFDSTATIAARNLITNTKRFLIPQGRPFAKQVWKLDKYREVLGSRYDLMLQDNNTKLFNHFISPKSNFFVELGPALNDGTIAGTGAIAFIDIEGKPLQYAAVPVDQLYFLEDYTKRSAETFREHSMTATQIIQRFPKLDRNFLSDAEEAPTAKHKVIECAIPDGDTWETSVYLESGWKEIDYSMSRWNPFVVWRWEKGLGNIWGDSPARDALPHIRTVNQMYVDMLARSDKEANGAYQTRDESFNADNMKSFSGGDVLITEEPVEELPIPGNFNTALQAIEMERRQIEKLMFDMSLPPDKDLKYMNDEALLARQNEFMNVVGEPSLRIQWELLQPIAEQAVGRLTARGELDTISPSDLKMIISQYGWDEVLVISDILEIRVDAAIKQAIDLNDAQTNLQSVSLLLQAQLGQQLVEEVDLSRFTRQTIIKLGVSEDLLRTKEQKQQLQQQRQQQQMMQQAGAALEQSPQAAEAIQGITNPPVV